MGSLLESLQDLIQPSPYLLMLRNIVFLGIGIFIVYRVVFGPKGAWLRERFPFLNRFSIDLQAKKLVKSGEHAQAGELYLSHGMHRKAVDVFLSGDMYGRAADIYLNRKNLDKAAGLYERAGQLEKAANIYVQRKNLEKAEELLTKLGKSEEIGELYEKLGSKALAANAYVDTGRIKDAVRLYAEAGDFHAAAAKLKEIYDNYETMFNRELGFASRKELALKAGEFFMRTKNFDEAAELFLKEELYKEAGDAFNQAKEYEKAVECFEKGSHFFEAAEVYYQLGKHQKAASLEAEGFIRDGDEVKAAKCYIKAGDYAGAGDVYRNMGEPLKAGEMYEKAREYALAGSMFSQSEQYERAGACFEKAKKYDEAIDQYGQAQNFARQVALLEKQGYFVKAAENYFQRGLVDEARAMLEKVDPEDKDYKKACGLEGKLLMQQGKLSEAKEKLEAAVSNIEKIASDDVDTIYDLAQVSEKLGQDSRALFTIEKMLAEDFVKGGSANSMQEMKKRLSTVLTKSSRKSSIMATAQFADAITLDPLQKRESEGEKRYVPIKEIGKGGMGIVYTARDAVLDRIIALKVLPANLKKNKQAVATFLREGRNAASLNHKNIVTVHDAGVQEGEYFIAMELIDGATIKELIKKSRRLSLRSVYAVLRQLLEGLAYAHEKQIVHRDLTNNNIMWSSAKLVKIMDFGLAKVIRELQSEQSIIGGTPSYMSPEQTLGNPIDRRTDIYSLGICLYEMCIGELPFKKGNLGYHHVHTKPPNPLDKNPKLPDGLAKVILKCLEKDPKKRPQSISEVREALKQDKDFA